MSDTKFTPGPWVVAEEAKIKHPEGTLIAQAQFWTDARLIAAAPDLYEALEYCIKNIPELADVPGIRVAIAKARGESHA